MIDTTALSSEARVPQALIRALFRHPQTLQAALADARLAPRDLAMWARQTGAAPDIEKLAGWLSVGQQLGRYKPLLEAAASHLRAGDLFDALPVFRWAYQSWQSSGPSGDGLGYRYDGAKLLALWGECLYRLDEPDQARERWLWCLAVTPDAETLTRLARTMERVGAVAESERVLAEAARRRMPGAEDLLHRCRHLAVASDPVSTSKRYDPAVDGGNPRPRIDILSTAKDGDPKSPVAVMADVANLDLVCGDQYGLDRRLDYGRLLQAAGNHGPVQACIAFVPDIPETLAVRQHLAGAGFDVELKRPKRSHGRIAADADAAIAASAVRWAGSGQVGRLELWTGDGDLLAVRQVVGQAWPAVTVAFRSFEVGTAGDIRRLGADWAPIGPEYLLA